MPPTLQRAVNVLRRLKAGLPARGGVSPEVPNDLFQAHLALYVFAAALARGKRVLDLGCGTGYGSARMAGAGAGSVVGLDSDAKSLAYARKRFSGPAVRFVQGSVEALPGDLGTFDLVVAANLLPHLASPAAAVDAVARLLSPEGALLASVAPIVDDRTMEQHRAAGVHRSNLYLWDWESLFRKRFQEIRLFQALSPAGATLDFTDPSPSKLRAEDFGYEEVPLARLASVGGLGAVFLCRGVRGT
ncbi:MAG TPA: class I SAM-dependent methyltransferase [Thermoanaerobaculia bacterium]|nr:class I SAM-dependent methyltransferase [Thermoanaerobaculia bacterium]